MFSCYLREAMSNPTNPNYKHFKNITSYNCALSLASMSIKVEHMPHVPYCFKLQGKSTTQLHTCNPLMVKKEQLLTFTWYTLMKQKKERKMRNTSTHNYNALVIQELDKITRQNNVFAKAYKTISEVDNWKDENSIS